MFVPLASFLFCRQTDRQTSLRPSRSHMHIWTTLAPMCRFQLSCQDQVAHFLHIWIWVCCGTCLSAHCHQSRLLHMRIWICCGMCLTAHCHQSRLLHIMRIWICCWTSLSQATILHVLIQIHITAVQVSQSCLRRSSGSYHPSSLASSNSRRCRIW